ncbi:hypothetical protein XU18_1908 [Perkinsela sp. CCAP 1560/4]|nr:hypothetical protein XU18_1908 [Perkinsela sp. CCAP 1560/4]|eukprot:KNH07376.1 hypothetical protein XU18_1908 [Perkinsela sp. CCAP 1560/4]
MKITLESLLSTAKKYELGWLSRKLFHHPSEAQLRIPPRALKRLEETAYSRRMRDSSQSTGYRVFHSTYYPQLLLTLPPTFTKECTKKAFQTAYAELPRRTRWQYQKIASHARARHDFTKNIAKLAKLSQIKLFRCLQTLAEEKDLSVPIAAKRFRELSAKKRKQLCKLHEHISFEAKRFFRFEAEYHVLLENVQNIVIQKRNSGLNYATT